MHSRFFPSLVLGLLPFSLAIAEARVASLDPAVVNNAQWSQRRPAGQADAARVKAGVLLDRARFAPGEIDGRDGDNIRQAITAFQQAQALKADGRMNRETWNRLVATSSEPVLVQHSLTKDDLRGPFTKRIPAGLEAMSRLPRLGYRDTVELLAEKFHMSPALLRTLNPGQKFRLAGQAIVVAHGRDEPSDVKVAKIEVDKGARVVRAFDGTGKLIAQYPASIGSDEKPAPSGTFTIRKIVRNPTYTYDPKFQFKGVEATERFRVAAGPNNPVGSVWIGLSELTYGLHGTPEPGRIRKRSTHGCVRLTNWDAEDLAKMTDKGASVVFIDANPAPATASR
jgi:lipoprotein-anchoring transpeptidase ErfK/SrfK